MSNRPQQPINPNQQQVFQNVIFNKAHQEMLRGADILYSAVKSTMGPSGKSVIIDQGYGRPPLITKDGISVAKAINLKEKLPSIGAELIKEISAKTNDLAGDGSTTATVLGYTMFKKGVQMIATGRSSIDLKRGMEHGVDIVLQFLKEKAEPINSRQDIINVGTISANGDRELGTLIADAIEKVGQDGIVTIEPAKSVNTSLSVVEGLQIDSGYSSPFFITNSDKANCVLENPLVLITNNKISSLTDLVPTLEIAIESEKERPILIIADEVEGEALHALIVNKTKGVIQACVVKAPSYGEYRNDILSDISTVVGGEIIGAMSANNLANIKEEQLGSCAKVIVNRNNTIILANTEEERKEKIEERIRDIRNILDTDTTLDALRIAKYRQRLARLSGGIAVINVGGSTEVEIREKKDRVEDAVNATIAASQEGIVAGGGVILFYAALYLKGLIKAGGIKNTNQDFLAGVQTIAEVCEAPLRTIVSNTGYSEDVVASELKHWYEKYKTVGGRGPTSREQCEQIKKADWAFPEELLVKVVSSPNTPLRYGFDASKGEYVDMIESGILDPIKVTRLSLGHAVSIVGLMITCDACIVNVNESLEDDSNR